jgi:hypothetical protein
MDAGLERFPPLLLHSLLQAARRYDPCFYDHLCRRFHLDADRILGLFREVEEIGPGQLQGVLEELRARQAYHEMVFLAGRNALLGWAEANRVTLNHSGGAERFQALLKQLLPDYLGRSSYNQMTRGRVSYVEVRDSVFARDVQHPHPVCGFYAGFLSELGSGCLERHCAVVEVRCRAAEAGATSCMFQVPL